jgi:hypothetical protein
LDIFATVAEKRRAGQPRSRFMRYDKINSNRFKRATPAELKKPSNAKELHGQNRINRAHCF